MFRAASRKSFVSLFKTDFRYAALYTNLRNIVCEVFSLFLSKREVFGNFTSTRVS